MKSRELAIPTNLPLESPNSFGIGEGAQRDALKIMWHGRWIILLCIVLAIAGGFIYISRQTPIYSSSARVFVERDSPKIMGESVAGPYQSDNYLATQCELIKSPQILGTVADQPEIRSMKTFEGMSSAIGRLRADIVAELNPKDDLITIAFESPYASEAADVVNAVIDSYRSYHSSRKKSTALEILRILEERKKESDKELDGKVQEMLHFKRDNPDMFFVAGDRGNIIFEQLSKLSDALSTARLNTLEAKSTFDAAKGIVNKPAALAQWLKLQENSAAVNSPIAAEADRLEMDLLNLNRKLLPDSEIVKEAEFRIAELRKRMDQQVRQSYSIYLANVEQRWLSAKERQEALQKEYDLQQKDAKQLNAQTAKYAMLESEVRRLEKRSEEIEARINQVRVPATEDVANLTIDVLEYAQPPTVPVKPKRSMIIFGALSLGLVAGCGLAYVRGWIDHRLRSVEEIQNLMGLNILGVVPTISGGRAQATRGQLTELEPMSDAAEAYRTVRTAIYFGAPNGAAKTILVTSPAPSDGKSTTASNIAIAMAQAGRRVLVLDADFRRPTQHKIFGIPEGLGFCDALSLRAKLGEVVRPPSNPRLFVLPCGTIPGNPSEMLGSHYFVRMVELLSEKFDHIVIDSPPVLPVTDARILGAGCDITILVLRAEKSTRRTSLQARDDLVAVGARILGLVVNDVPRRRSAYGYREYGGHYRYDNRSNGSAKAVEGSGKFDPAPVTPSLPK